MANRNMAATAADCKIETGLPADPIPALYREYCRVANIVGSTLPSMESKKTRIFADAGYMLEHRILSTPATSLEGVARQLQILATEINNCGCDPENHTADSAFYVHLWIAMFGALNLILPQFEVVPDEQHYGLGEIDRCPDEGLDLFRKLAQGGAS